MHLLMVKSPKTVKSTRKFPRHVGRLKIVEAFVAVGRLNVGRSFRLGAFAEAVDGGESGNPWDRFPIFGDSKNCVSVLFLNVKTLQKW